MSILSIVASAVINNSETLIIINIYARMKLYIFGKKNRRYTYFEYNQYN